MAHENLFGRLTVSWVILFAAPLFWIVLAFLHPQEPQQAGRWLFVADARTPIGAVLADALLRYRKGRSASTLFEHRSSPHLRRAFLAR